MHKHKMKTCVHKHLQRLHLYQQCFHPVQASVATASVGGGGETSPGTEAKKLKFELYSWLLRFTTVKHVTHIYPDELIRKPF